MPNLKLEVNRYIGIFYKRNSRGQWRKFWQIGNAGVAENIAALLVKLGYKVQVVDVEPQNDEDED